MTCRQVSCWVLIIGLTTTVGCETERAKWNLAQAMNLREEGKLGEAIRLVQIAMEQSPEDDRIKLRLATLLSENGQGEFGVEFCDEYLERYPNDPDGHSTRTFCLQYLGRFDESLADYKKRVSSHLSKSAIELNNLAYFRALANEDLDRAAREIQEAVEITQATFRGMRWPVSLSVQTVIGAGLVSRHIEKRKQALRYLDRYIARFETGLGELDLEELQAALKRNENANWLDVGGSKNEAGGDPQVSPLQSKTEFMGRNLALLLATRALIYEDLKKTRCADADRRRLVELGFEFEQIVDELPSDFACLGALETACIFLDTRGFVMGRMEWKNIQERTSSQSGGNQLSHQGGGNRLALEDLNLAVLAAQFQQRALNSSLFNSTEISPNAVHLKKKTANRMTAVLLFHRMEVHRQAGNFSAAKKDEICVERLGYPPGSNLF